MKIFLRKILLNILLISVITLFNFWSYANAATAFNGARDLVSVDTPGARTTHLIGFSLPVGNYPTIDPTDYIFIKMDNFTDITEPTYLTGSVNTEPVFSMQGKTVVITGVTLGLGQFASVMGIGATNPMLEDDMFIQIIVSRDAGGNDIKYSDGVTSARQNNRVTMRAMKSGDVGSLRISGYASPGMFISFFEGGNSLGTTMAATDGTFFQNFPGLPSAEHTITIYGVDQFNRVTPGVVLEDILTPVLQAVLVSDVIMPPTVHIDKEEIKRGDTIKITGSSIPGYKAIIFTEPPLKSMETTAGANGEYTFDFSDTNDLDLGDHKVFAISQNTTGGQSLQSVMLFYKVISGQEPPDSGSGTCSIERGNLNCDENNNVDLADFSILMYYWGTNMAAADINGDGAVDLIDFSIMMFYWGS